MGRLKTAMFHDVEVLRDAGTAFLCQVGKRRVWVPLSEIRYGTDLTKTRDQGRLIVSHWCARSLGLE